MHAVDLASDEGRALVRGAVELETTEHGVTPQRLTARARGQGDAQLVMATSQPSGVRLAFRTEARALELLTVPTKRVYAGAPPRPDGVYDLVVDGRLMAQRSAPEGRVARVDLGRGTSSVEPGSPVAVRFDDVAGEGAGAVDVEIWLPHDETTELVSLRSDAPVEPLTGSRPTWVHHGSSISQGSNAASPSGTWVATAARSADVDLVNLGLGGSMMLDQSVARVVRDLPADLLSVKVGINIVNGDVMRLRAFTAAVHGFLDTVRDGHPTTPLLLVSPILCPIHEDTPGPAAFDPEALAEGRLSFRAVGDPDEVSAGRLTLRVIRAELARVVAARDDARLGLLDGLQLYGPDDAVRRPLPDALHPDAETHQLMGERFADLAFGPEGLLARVTRAAGA